MIAFNTPKLAKNNTSNTLDFSNTNLQPNKEIDLLLTDESPITVTPDAGYLGMQQVTINHPPVEELTETEITQNGEFHITPSQGYDATMGVTANVQVTGKPKTLDITKNGTYTVTGDDQPISQVTVNAKVVEPATTWTDLDGMKYSNSTITKFQDGYKLAPRTGINCYGMFSSCRKFTEVPLFDTSEATEMSQMFTNTTSLQTIPEFNTEKATSFGSMFSYSGIVTFPTLNTPLLENADYMFNYCGRLISVGKLDFSNVTSAIQMFYHSNKLTTLGGFTGLKVNFDLSYCTLLTKESILNVINEAADVTASPKSIYLGETNLAKLTDEEKAIATNKGWTLA